jgi:hypothetical protein
MQKMNRSIPYFEDDAVNDYVQHAPHLQPNPGRNRGSVKLCGEKKA